MEVKNIGQINFEVHSTVILRTPLLPFKRVFESINSDEALLSIMGDNVLQQAIYLASP